VRLLLVEDRQEHADLVVARLRRAGIDVEAVRVQTPQAMERALEGPVDLVIADYSMPAFSGPAALDLLQRSGLDIPCIVVSGTVGEETAVETMRAGAADYVMKDNLARLPFVVRRELREARERAARRAAEAAFAGASDRLSGLLRAAGPLAVMCSGGDGLITDFSEGAERMLGHAASEVVGRADLTLPHDPVELADRAARLGIDRPLDALLASAGGEGEGDEWTYVRADGSRLPVVVTVAAIGGDAGDAAGYVVIARDISQRRRREREQEALRLVATAVAADPGPDEVFALVAREAAALLGADASGVSRLELTDSVEMGSWARAGAAAFPVGTTLPLDGPNAVAVVSRTGRCARIDDLHAVIDEPTLAAWGRMPEFRAVIACPVRVAGTEWGALWAGSATPGAFGDDDQARLSRFADLVGLAVANAEARERVVSETLAGVFRGEMDVGETLDMIVHSARRALDADRATCYVVDERDEAVSEVHTTETDPERRAYLERAVGRRQRDLPIWQLLRRQPESVLIIEDAAAEAVLPPDLARRLGSGAIVGLRLEHSSLTGEGGKEELGGLFLSYSRARRFSSRERTAAESLAGMAAVALANARLHAASLRTAAQVEAGAVIDPLTGLANHRSFQERLEQEVTRARRHSRSLALALIDIDRFRLVNEQHGHEAGDRVLVALARRLQEMARDTDVVARVGGEELAWLMPETEAMAAWQAVDRAREAVARMSLDVVGRITVSAGVCDLAQAGSAGELQRLAEGALYWAKQHGRDVAFLFSPEVVEVLSAEERVDRLQRFQALQSIKVLARAVDAKDHSTREHSERVAELSVAIAGALGWDAERLVRLREAGLVHDVGKIGVPDRVLFKPARLTPAEYEEITRHAAIGAAMVADVLTPEQVSWVRGHHERWDGRGYPDRLASDAIPDGAQVLALADAWDVMTSERPYHEPLSTDEALAEIKRCSGTQFSAVVVEVMEELVLARALPVMPGS
jgi:diguanylate cyclase (GGDEF)-like protein/PAS domain S-box-containing protein